MAEEEKTGQNPQAEAAAQNAQPAPAQDPHAKHGEKAEKKDKKKDKAEGRLAAAEEKLEQVGKELESAKDRLLRTAAEYDNFRRRTAKEKDAAFGNGVAFAVEKLLPVLDTLTLAAAAETADESYKKGVTMTLEQCAAAFAAMGVEEIDAAEKPFDPALMSAVMQQPAPEGTASGTVLQVLQKGYTYGGKVVRHATVMVAE